jgi:hypothetical protein
MFFTDRMNMLEELQYSRIWGAAMKRTYFPGFLAILLFFMISAIADPALSAPVCDGDLTRDGAVNIADALKALRISVQLVDPTTEDMTQGDVFPFGADGKPSPDGFITISDALIILKKTVGLFDWDTRPEPSPPFVTTKIPADGNTGSARSSTAIAVFNEGLDPATITPATFFVRDAANIQVRGTVKFNGITATFVPQTYLDPLTTYTATVSGLVRDLAGNAMGSDHSWTFTTGAAPAQPILSISSLSTNSAAPLSYLTLTGEGFDPAARLAVSFFDNNGFGLDVPILEATASSITVAVPPYFSPSTGTFGPGTVNVRLLQYSNGSISGSNTITGFQINSLPALSLPAGSVSANVAGFLELTLADTENQLLELDASSAGQINTVILRAQLESIRTQYGQLKSKIRNAIANPGQLETIGQINGVPVSLDQESLRVADQWMVAVINGILAELQGAPVQQAFRSSATKLLALAQATACTDDPAICQSLALPFTGMKTAGGSEVQNSQKYLLYRLQSASSILVDLSKKFGAATATVGAAIVTAGGSIPLNVVVLLTTANVIGGSAQFGMDAAVLSAKPSDKEAAKRLLDDFNGQIESVVTGVISPIVGERSKLMGNLFDLIVGWKPILEDKLPAFLSQARAFIDMAPPPPACTYSYSAWTACQSNNTQTRTLISSNPSGCVGTPVLTQSCTYVPPLPGNSFRGPFSGTTTEISTAATIVYDVSANVTLSVSGSGTLIDPYTGTMKIDGTIEYNAIVNPPYTGGGIGSVPFSFEGPVSGSNFRVQAATDTDQIFTGGIINGNRLTGTLSFSVGCYYECAEPILKAITLTK